MNLYTKIIYYFTDSNHKRVNWEPINDEKEFTTINLSLKLESPIPSESLQTLKRLM